MYMLNANKEFHWNVCTMIIIRIFSTYCQSSVWRELEQSYGFERDPAYNVKYRFTEGNDYTHVILFNCAGVQVNVPKENVIGVAQEPPTMLGMTPGFVHYVHYKVAAYLVGDSRGLPHEFVEDNAYLPHCHIPKEINMEKPKLMSIALSTKSFMPGHIYRNQLLYLILQSNLPIDIYGHGAQNLLDRGANDSRLKGKFNKPIEVFNDYWFTIAAENSSFPAYFSEKVIDPLLHHCIPLYYGCTRIEQYLPGMTIPLNGHPGVDMHTIKDVVENPMKYMRKIDVDDVVKRTSLTNAIHKYFIKEDPVSEDMPVSEPAPVAQDA